MIRTFSEHLVRTNASLNGLWQLQIEQSGSKKKGRTRLPERYDRKILVPSAWELQSGLENYRGRAWLRTKVPAVKGMATRVVFGGVSHTGTAYVDGKRCGSHYDAFTPWDIVVPAVHDGMRELVVEVDNSFGSHSALHMPNDYYTYGGITRPVEVEFLSSVYIDKIFATPVLVQNKWNLDVRVRLKNWTKKKLTRRIVLAIANVEVDFGDVTVLPGGAQEFSTVLSSIAAEPWSPDSPKLYSLWVRLYDGETLLDDLIDRIGFREVRVRGKELLLNGEPIRLHGFCRHEDHPQFGCALPLEAMATDLKLIRDMGCNFIRSVHYPNDMRFLDLCDEMGLCVWEESHARTVDFNHVKFREQIEAVTEEMVEWHFNRPSILMWGCLNECDSVTVSGRNHYKRVLKQLRTLDSSRPITFADCFGRKNRCLDLVDIVAWNRYDAWYGADDVNTIEQEVLDMLEWLHSSSKGSGKPVIMSEFGAGAIHGCRSPNRVKWTEEYQADVLDESLRVYLNHPDIIGTAIWQFCDVRVTREGDWWQRRPRTMNNKGIVDEYRRPKLAYDIVKKRIAEQGKQKRKNNNESK